MNEEISSFVDFYFVMSRSYRLYIVLNCLHLGLNLKLGVCMTRLIYSSYFNKTTLFDIHYLIAQAGTIRNRIRPRVK